MAATRWDQLDHVRAAAAFLVFTWHFTHGSSGTPVPFEGAPILPGAALFDEGHFGVSVFMTLSGYLFAKLLEGKDIVYWRFILARIIRLFPLLIFAFAVRAVVLASEGGDMDYFRQTLTDGFIYPVWPNGAWSITAELHFYLLLPLVLVLRRNRPLALPVLLGMAIAWRMYQFFEDGSVQELAYWTIVGRIDQFLLGILAFDTRARFTGRHLAAFCAFTALCIEYYWFDAAGGFYFMLGAYPSPSPIWIVWPAFEGLACALLIAWYDTTFAFDNRLSRFVAWIGFLSYEIYLLHFFFFEGFARAVHEHVMPIGNFYLAWAWAVPFFLLMLLPSWLVFKLVEQPLQRFKPDYVRRPRPANDGPKENQTGGA